MATDVLQTLISWVVLSVGGGALAVRPVRTYTCRAYDSAAVVLERPGQAAMRLEEIIALRAEDLGAVVDTADHQPKLDLTQQF